VTNKAGAGNGHNGPRRSTFVIALLLAGLALHFFRLDQPAAIIFDEVHFGGFANAYCCTGEYIFDVHPPHGKLLAALGMKLGGYDGGQSFATIGTPLADLDPWLLRLAPALTGSLVPVLVFIILVQLGASLWAAVLGGWAVLFDNALLLQTRVLALDGTLILSMLGAISLALLAISQRSVLRQSLLSLGAGLCVGMAVGTKLTGLTSALLVAVILLAPLLQGGKLLDAIRMSAFAATGAIVVYLGGWVLHFLLLDQPGPGDIWGVPSGTLVHDIIDIHRSMFQANYGLTATHPNGSAWWGWPWMWRPLYYYAGPNFALYLIGNPVVWWGSSIGLLCVLWGLLRGVFGGERPENASATTLVIRHLPLLGFLVSFLPFIVIPRVMFLYHYLPSLVFAVCAVALWLDRHGWTQKGGFAEQSRAVRWLLIAIPVGFLVISPITYGFALPSDILSALVKLVH
jgi:dolichyl-phosphate-mannose-protein mannosyltransferase